MGFPKRLLTPLLTRLPFRRPGVHAAIPAQNAQERRAQLEACPQVVHPAEQVRDEQELAVGSERHADTERNVRGKPYHQWVETIEQLKREQRHEEVLALLYDCIEAAERDRGGAAPAPAFTEHAAIVHRKMRDYGAEVTVLQRWTRLASGPEQQSIRISSRLEKAQALRQRKALPA